MPFILGQVFQTKFTSSDEIHTKAFMFTLVVLKPNLQPLSWKFTHTSSSKHSTPTHPLLLHTPLSLSQPYIPCSPPFTLTLHSKPKPSPTKSTAFPLPCPILPIPKRSAPPSLEKLQLLSLAPTITKKSAAERSSSVKSERPRRPKTWPQSTAS